MSPTVERYIAQAIQDYDPSVHPLSDRLREIVVEHEVLPLMFDLAVCVGIRADLTMWDILWEDWGDVLRVSDGPRPVVEQVNRDAALIIGTTQHPPLRTLLPERPSPAPICARCDEVGADAEGEPCVVCHGLGWIPERWCESEFFNVDLKDLTWR